MTVSIWAYSVLYQRTVIPFVPSEFLTAEGLYVKKQIHPTDPGLTDETTSLN